MPSRHTDTLFALLAETREAADAVRLYSELQQSAGGDEPAYSEVDDENEATDADEKEATAAEEALAAAIREDGQAAKSIVDSILAKYPAYAQQPSCSSSTMGPLPATHHAALCGIMRRIGVVNSETAANTSDLPFAPLFALQAAEAEARSLVFVGIEIETVLASLAAYHSTVVAEESAREVIRRAFVDSTAKLSALSKSQGAERAAAEAALTEAKEKAAATAAAAASKDGDDDDLSFLMDETEVEAKKEKAAEAGKALEAASAALDSIVRSQAPALAALRLSTAEDTLEPLARRLIAEEANASIAAVGRCAAAIASDTLFSCRLAAMWGGAMKKGGNNKKRAIHGRRWLAALAICGAHQNDDESVGDVMATIRQIESELLAFAASSLEDGRERISNNNGGPLNEESSAATATAASSKGGALLASPTSSSSRPPLLPRPPQPHGGKTPVSPLLSLNASLNKTVGGGSGPSSSAGNNTNGGDYNNSDRVPAKTPASIAAAAANNGNGGNRLKAVPHPPPQQPKGAVAGSGSGGGGNARAQHHQQTPPPPFVSINGNDATAPPTSPGSSSLNSAAGRSGRYADQTTSSCSRLVIPKVPTHPPSSASPSPALNQPRGAARHVRATDKYGAVIVEKPSPRRRGGEGESGDTTPRKEPSPPACANVEKDRRFAEGRADALARRSQLAEAQRWRAVEAQLKAVDAQFQYQHIQQQQQYVYHHHHQAVGGGAATPRNSSNRNKKSLESQEGSSAAARRPRPPLAASRPQFNASVMLDRRADGSLPEKVLRTGHYASALRAREERAKARKKAEKEAKRAAREERRKRRQEQLALAAGGGVEDDKKSPNDTIASPASESEGGASPASASKPRRRSKKTRSSSSPHAADSEGEKEGRDESSATVSSASSSSRTHSAASSASYSSYSDASSSSAASRASSAHTESPSPSPRRHGDDAQGRKQKRRKSRKAKATSESRQRHEEEEGTFSTVADPTLSPQPPKKQQPQDDEGEKSSKGKKEDNTSYVYSDDEEDDGGYSSGGFESTPAKSPQPPSRQGQESEAEGKAHDSSSSSSSSNGGSSRGSSPRGGRSPTQSRSPSRGS